MNIRTKLFTIFMSIAFVFVGAIVHESILAHKRAVSRSSLTRAEVTTALIADLSLQRMEEGDLSGMRKPLSSIARLQHISYLRISDTKGIPVFAHADPGIKFDNRRADVSIGAVEDGIFDIKKDLINNGRSYGTLELGMPLDPDRGERENVLWRAIFRGVVFLCVLAVLLWVASSRLATDLRMLVSAAGKMKDPEMPSLPVAPKGSEMGELSAAFRDFHDTLAEEKNMRKETETLSHDFFAMTVHDLKQPITVLKAVNELMLEEIKEGTYKKNGLNHIACLAKDSLNRLNGMVEDILNIAKLSDKDIPVQKERIMLDTLVKESAEENSVIVTASGRRWSLKTTPETKNRSIYGDDVLIRRLIGNLILNAIHYTPEGGEINLGVRFKNNECVELFVSDQGAGIPEKFREEIFKKYTSLSKTAKNVGLGLAFCKLVAERHAAQLNVRSEEGKGTEISLVIPVSCPEPAHPLS